MKDARPTQILFGILVLYLIWIIIDNNAAFLDTLVINYKLHGHSTMTSCKLIVYTLALVFISFPPIANATDLKAAYEAALEDPFDDTAFQNLLSLLPKIERHFAKDKTFYLVEGDIPLSAKDVRAHLVARSSGAQAAAQKPELIVNVNAGQPTYWSDPNKRTLHYAILKQTFPDDASYAKVVADMAAAGGEWAAICKTCGIEVVHKPEHDTITNVSEYQALTDTDELRFAVIYQELGGGTIAMAFFPHETPLQRLVAIDPSYFQLQGPDDFAPIGVLRHELGHVLGYRHEHTRDVAGCKFEDNEWIPLTPYDPHSVMHYFCGGKGSLELQITDVDRKGHTRLYSPAAAGNTPQ